MSAAGRAIALYALWLAAVRAWGAARLRRRHLPVDAASLTWPEMRLRTSDLADMGLAVEFRPAPSSSRGTQ